MKVLARFKHEPVMENGHYRWDVYGIVRNVTEVIREAAREGEPVVSIGFDTFGTDFGLLDGDGRLIEKPIANPCMPGLAAASPVRVRQAS